MVVEKNSHITERFVDNHYKTPKRPDDMQAAAVDYVAKSPQKVSAGVLRDYISDRFKMSKHEARRIVSQSVTNGELSYTYEFGTSYLEVSFIQPLRVGRRLFLVPSGWEESPSADCVMLRVQPGVAFGCGRHPTTRLALRGLEAVLSRKGQWRPEAQATSALDIGTGSGILAIAALKLGIDRAVGIDRDVCARTEAAGNAVLNHLETRLVITDGPLSRLFSAAPFTLIMANLRYPTLLNLKTTVAGLLEPDGALVLSGIKTEEQAGIRTAYAEYGLHNWWTEEEKGWTGIVFRHGPIV